MSKISLPGLIDPHVHLRDPGQTQKEDFYTGTSAALSGGYTTVLDMPNNKIPITSLARLEEKMTIARQKIVCDVGFYFGSVGDNFEEFEKVRGKALGLKLYLNETTGNFLIDKNSLEKIFKAWPTFLPILLHAEDDAVDLVLALMRKTRNRIHFCHISTKSDLAQIIGAKEEGLTVTCGVTPHHLFLTENDLKNLGSFGKMKPPLRSKKDVKFLWKNLRYIDMIESDHAPHTIEEKQLKNTPFGVPGLETTLPLLLTAVSEKRLTIEDIIRLCHTNPAKIFGIKTDSDTKVIIDLNASYIIYNSLLLTKCRWSPFEGKKIKGKVSTVFIRGQKVFEGGKVRVNPGFARVLFRG
ncbi:MAG: amidohydrolase family protein [Candidatus Levybacteria bacterium]|nr:amidohydrolase family protein [Candidatus Levybacteria bacterium]